jgi:hypothetical protein
MDGKKAIKIGFTCSILCLMGLFLVPLVAADDNGVCYYDFKWFATDHIGSDKAPMGSEYIVATVYIKNESDKSVSTSPSNWNLIIDGLKYTDNLNTYDHSLYTPPADVIKGGETETNIVYLVKGNPKTVTIHYDGSYGPEMKAINHYNHTSI